MNIQNITIMVKDNAMYSKRAKLCYLMILVRFVLSLIESHIQNDNQDPFGHEWNSSKSFNSFRTNYFVYLFVLYILIPQFVELLELFEQ